MTVSTTNNRVSYAGNGVTTAFSFPNKFFADTDLVVLVVTDATGASVTKTLTTDYTVTGAGAPTGGTVTMVVAPATGTTLVIYRNPPLTQLTDLVDGDPFSVETGVEAPLDRQMLVIQRLYDLISRSLRLADSDTTSASTSLPTPVASNFLGWNATATALQNYVAADLALHPVSTYIATLLDDVDAATARTTLGALAASVVSSYGLTLIGDASAAAARTTLGSSATGDALFTAASAAAARTTLGSTTVGDALFIAASALAARSTLGVAGISGDTPIQGTRLFGIEAQAQNTTYYIGENGLSGATQMASTTEGDMVWWPSVPVTVRDLYATISAAPPAGQTVTLTLRKNGADTTLTAQITSTGGVVSDTSHTVSAGPGDYLSLKCVTSATTGTMNVSASLRFTDPATGAGVSNYPFSLYSNNVTAVAVSGLAGGAGALPQTEPYAHPVVHSNCYLKSFLKKAGNASSPAATLSVGTAAATIKAYLNTVLPPLGNSLSLFFTGFLSGLLIPLDASSYYKFNIAVDASGNNQQVGCWTIVQKTSGGENQVMPLYFTSRQQAQATTLYMGGHACTGNATEATKQFPLTAGTLKNFILMNEGAGVGGETWTANVRVNGATVATLTLSGAATVAVDTSTSVAVTAGQKVSVQLISSALTGTRDIQFAMDHVT